MANPNEGVYDIIKVVACDDPKAVAEALLLTAGLDGVRAFQSLLHPTNGRRAVIAAGKCVVLRRHDDDTWMAAGDELELCKGHDDNHDGGTNFCDGTCRSL